MKLKILIVLAAMALSFGWRACAQIYDTNNEVVQTFDGSAFTGYLDGQGQQTMFSSPSQIVSDSSSNLYVWDSGNSRIRKISPDGTVTTFAGSGVIGNNLPAVGTNAALGLFTFYSMTMTSSNVILVSSDAASGSGSGGYGTPTLLIIQPNGLITQTNLPNMGSLNSGNPNSCVCVDSTGNIYYTGGNKIYRWLTNGSTEVFVGSGNTGAIDGNGIFTSFNSPTYLVCDAANNIYVWDSGNYLIRRINQNRDVVTIAGSNLTTKDGVGTNATFTSGVSAMAADNSGNIYLACYYSIRKMDAATNVVTMAGSFSQAGYTNGAGNLARFYGASGVCLSHGSIFVADSGNQRIRQISFNPQPQVVSAANLSIGTFAGLTITGVVGRTYQIQTSPDFTTWTTKTTLLLNSSPYLWIDQNPVSGNKFYRALLLP
jgi:NHL repeat-containing protein